MNRITFALIAGSITLTSAVVLAHEEATAVVKERMDLMKTIGKQTKTLSGMFKGEAPYDAVTVSEAAAVIHDHGGEQLTVLFPEESLDPPTEALPAIWQDWTRFESLAGQLADASGALVLAAGNPRPADGDTMRGGQAMMGSGMMSGQGMMVGEAAAPDPEVLATMPPDAAFMHLAQTCSSCHTKFRVEKEKR